MEGEQNPNIERRAWKKMSILRSCFQRYRTIWKTCTRLSKEERTNVKSNRNRKTNNSRQTVIRERRELNRCQTLEKLLE